MTRIPEEDRDAIEQAIYLPMVLIVLNRDMAVVHRSPFKLKQPYLNLIEEAMKIAQKDLAAVKRYLKSQQIKVFEQKRDQAFTMYTFLYKGYEEHHNYFNPRIRNKVQELLEYYLFQAGKQRYKEESRQTGP